MTHQISIGTHFNVSPAAVFNAWLDSELHSKMTGAPASVSDQIDGAFEAWEGYITGYNLELIPDQKIVQSWRTSDFPEDAPNSVLEIHLSEMDGVCFLELNQSNLPEDQVDNYLKGWFDHYFTPMRAFFS